MEPATLRVAHQLYVECLGVGNFAKRRWNGPIIDTSFYDFNDSDVPSPILPTATAGFLSDLYAERTTLPKVAASREVLSTLRQWLTSLRSGKHPS
jgi:hypothetical protein